MGTPVEMEFAVNLSGDLPKEFALLQIRPLAATTSGLEDFDLEADPESILCRSNQVLGNGVSSIISDIVAINPERFDRSKTNEAAREVTALNDKLVREGRPYLLGPGRWGSLDPWLGLPVKWEQISGARSVVECGFQDIDVAPSQGSHFFQNITSFQVAYFTVGPRAEQSFVDWNWIESSQPQEKLEHTLHIRLSSPLVVMVSGNTHQGIILKPGHTLEVEDES
jgi:hypothetical protein